MPLGGLASVLVSAEQLGCTRGWPYGSTRRTRTFTAKENGVLLGTKIDCDESSKPNLNNRVIDECPRPPGNGSYSTRRVPDTEAGAVASMVRPVVDGIKQRLSDVDGREIATGRPRANTA